MPPAEKIGRSEWAGRTTWAVILLARLSREAYMSSAFLDIVRS
jgi:hypothetical protein